MPIGGSLKLKGGLRVTSEGVVKKKKKSKNKDVVEGEEKKEEETKTGISVQGNNTYEEEFPLEMKKALEGKTKSVAWGSSYRAPPEILHGYTTKIKKPKTAEERLDLRSAMRGDKFCR